MIFTFRIRTLSKVFGDDDDDDDNDDRPLPGTAADPRYEACSAPKSTRFVWIPPAPKATKNKPVM